MDLNVALKRIIETGKAEFGSEKTVKSINDKKAKAIVIAANCPGLVRDLIENHAQIAKVPVVNYPGTSLQLGEVCGKPFLIASLAVIDTGNIQLSELKS